MELTGPADGEDEAEDAADLFRAVGRQLRLLRERAGLTQKELGERLGYSEELIRSLERGRRTPQAEFLDAADELLGAGGLLAAAKEDLERAKARARVKHPAWFKDYAKVEAIATELSYYSNHNIPGLFQTEAHARALYRMRKPLLDDDLIEQRVAARLARQSVMTDKPVPMVNCIIEEAVLRRPIGEWPVHKEQLGELARLGRLRNVELQVMPLDRPEHAGMGGPFTLLTPQGKPQVGYVEVQNISRLISDMEDVRILAARYGCIRSQALTPRESLASIERLLNSQ